MAKLVAIISLTLDGVMQAPGRPDEDRRGVYVLLIHPLVLGRGRRLFNDDAGRIPLHLVDSVTTTTGVVIATYNPDGPAPREGR